MRPSNRALPCDVKKGRQDRHETKMELVDLGVHRGAGPKGTDIARPAEFLIDSGGGSGKVDDNAS